MDKIAEVCLQAELNAVKHYMNALRCQDFARDCENEDGKKIYRRGVLKHKAKALIAYDRSITGRVIDFL